MIKSYINTTLSPKIRYVWPQSWFNKQAWPDPVVIREIRGERAKLEVSIDPEGILGGGKPCVLKSAQVSGNEAMRQSIRSEGAMLRFLGRQEHLIQYHGCWTGQKGGEHLVLEYIVGEDVETRISINPDKKLTTREVCHILRGVCRALFHMHELAVVHRSIEPSHIMIDNYDNRVVLLGLGAAERFVDTGKKWEFFDSPAYASPEYLNDLPLDGRSDIFSLGIVMVQMLTGRHPFLVEDNLEETRENILNSRMLPEVTNEIPQEYQSIVERMLAVDLADRYSNCEEILYDLMFLPLLP